MSNKLVVIEDLFQHWNKANFSCQCRVFRHQIASRFFPKHAVAISRLFTELHSYFMELLGYLLATVSRILLKA